MASEIIATPKGATSNSYVTMAEAATYFSNRLHKDAWTEAGSSDKTAALLWATRLLDTRILWEGEKTDQVQALCWPRQYVVDPEKANLYGNSQYLDENAIPLFLKDAQCELALSLLTSDVTQDPDSTGMDSVSVGSLSIQYNSNQKVKVLPRAVRDLVHRYGEIDTQDGAVSTLVRM